jgi:hypothetical protein
MASLVDYIEINVSVYDVVYVLLVDLSIKTTSEEFLSKKKWWNLPFFCVFERLIFEEKNDRNVKGTKILSVFSFCHYKKEEDRILFVLTEYNTMKSRWKEEWTREKWSKSHEYSQPIIRLINLEDSYLNFFQS